MLINTDSHKILAYLIQNKRKVEPVVGKEKIKKGK